MFSTLMGGACLWKTVEEGIEMGREDRTGMKMVSDFKVWVKSDN